MSEGDLEASGPADDEAPGKPPRRRGLRIALGCLAVMTTACLGVCGLAGYGFNRHASDVRRFEPAPMPDAATETDPNFRLLAEARASLGTGPIVSCSDLETEISDRLDELSHEDALAFHEWARARLLDLDSQPMREACQAARSGACPEAVFLWFRSYLVAMGRPTFALALADDDRALARILPKTARCRSFVDITYAAAVRSVLVEDAGIDAGHSAVASADSSVSDGGIDASIVEAPSDAGIEPESGLPPTTPIASTTSTRQLPRRQLAAGHPYLCRRFTCTVEDVFD